MTWLERRTIDLSIGDLPFDQAGSIDILDFSALRIILPDKLSPIDIGAMCFTQRKRKGPQLGVKGYSIWLVQGNSLRKERIIAIKHFSEYLYGLHKLGKRPRTIEIYIRAFDSFVQWSDNHFPLMFQTINDCREAYYHYTLALNEEVRKSVLHVNSAALKQRKLASVLRSIFQDTEGVVTAGIKRIRINKIAANNTVPPSEVTAQKAISLCSHLFTALSKFILDSGRYPFEMELPEESVWVFPGQKAFSTKNALSRRSQWKQTYWGWDYINGCVSDYESVHHHYASSNGALLCIENATQLLEQANQDNRHQARWYLASLAIQCFTVLFIANTAMNTTSLSQLCWDDSSEFEILKDTLQGFRTVKHRAGGVEVEFHITSHFLPYFRQYLKLRSWILQDGKAPLFFTLDNQRGPKKIDASLVTKLRIKLKAFELTIPSAREWRAYKADWLIRTTDVATASLLLQNSEETVLQNYSEGSKSRADREMTDFLQALHIKVVQPNAIPTQDISVGQCRDYHAPKNDGPLSVIQPDCHQPEGCLFCTNYRVHADEDDIRKLCSCQYVITQTRALAASETHFNEIFGVVVQRISGLLMTIGQKNEALKQEVARIQHEVTEDEQLTHYWSEKLRLLVDLGVV